MKLLSLTKKRQNLLDWTFSAQFWKKNKSVIIFDIREKKC